MVEEKDTEDLLEQIPEDKNILDEDMNMDNEFGFDDFDTGAQAPISKHSELLKELTNFDPIIQRRIRNWLGLEWDEKMQDYQQKQAAIINEKGARWAIGCLETYQAKPNIITNLSRDELVNIKLEIIDLCWLVFATKFDDFGIKDSADQWRLSNELQHSAFLVLAGAGDGKYTKFLGETHSVHEQVNVQPTASRGSKADGPGFMDSLRKKLLGRG